MSTPEIISLLASVASLIVSIGAIWLSIVFFRMSTEAANATGEAAKGIGASVERLEKLFDKLYSDTFSMMRDTVSDMRKHIWPEDTSEPEKTIVEVERKADEKVNELKKTMEGQISDLLHRQSIAGDQVDQIRDRMRELVDVAITGSRQVDSEAREDALKEHLLRELRILGRTQPSVTIADLLERLESAFPPRRIILELERLRADHLVATSSRNITPRTRVRLAVPQAAVIRQPWQAKGMCPECGQWVYMDELDRRRVHCTYPLVNITERDESQDG